MNANNGQTVYIEIINPSTNDSLRFINNYAEASSSYRMSAEPGASVEPTLAVGLGEPYTVSFNVNAGTKPADQHVYPGGKATRPEDQAIVKYDFDNWYKTIDYEGVFDFDTDTITADTTIYGRFLAAESKINVSVPVKLIFAAFESDNGAITAPKYHIKNNGSYPVDVSVDSLTIENADTLTLTATPLTTGDVSLKLRGSGTVPFNGTDFLTESSAINASIGTLAAAGDTYDTKYFTFEGTYKGSFDPPKQPNYVLGFRFALSP
jgi:hypothetical protein